MAEYTENYHLSKPESTDEVQDFISSYADNMDIIDENMGGGGGVTIIYTLSISGHTITLTGSNGSISSVTVPDNDTTYTLGFNGGTLSLTDSDGTAQTVNIPDTNTTYTMSLSGNVLKLTDSSGNEQTVTLSGGSTYTAGEGIEIDANNEISLAYFAVVNGELCQVYDDGQ